MPTGRCRSAHRRGWCAGRSISPRASDTIKREPLDDLPGEFPRFDERRAGLGYRQGWFAARAGPQNDGGFDSIAHVDLQTGNEIPMCFPAGDVPGEPVFVPRSAGAPEGDGWVIAVVYRAPRTAATSWCSTPPISRPGRSAWPRCRAGFPSAFTETGVRPKALPHDERPAPRARRRSIAYVQKSRTAC